MENLKWVLKYEQEFMAGEGVRYSGATPMSIGYLISKQLYEMETCPFYRWANQKGGENQAETRSPASFLRVVGISEGSHPSSQGSGGLGLTGRHTLSDWNPVLALPQLLLNDYNQAIHRWENRVLYV